MSAAFLTVLAVSGLFLAVLETAKRRLDIDVIYTRKTAHVFFFAVILASYYALTRTEAVAILALFLAAFSFSYAKYLLSSIHIKKYRTGGEILYILAFIALFIFFGANEYAFASGAFVLGLLDPASTAFNKSGKKKISYNLAYFFACLALLFMVALYFNRVNLAVLAAAAAAAAIADRYSEYGFDNLTVPLAVALISA